MIAKNLLVHGSSRFLNTAYFQDVSISGTATLSSLSLSGNLSVTGTSTLSGHVSVGGYNNTSYGLSANSAIINNWIRTVGSTGWYNESHGGGWWMKDHDYIRSYNKPVLMDHNIYFGTAGDSGYYVKTTGAAKFASVAAPAATISTVNTTNLSVSNNLRAAHFDLQTVAQLGGSFYVSPTVKFPNSGTTLTVAKSGSTLTLTITDSSITSTTMAGIVWSANSHVKVSGTINGVVTGTMDGTVSSINTSSHVLTLSVSGENSGSVVAGTYSASQFSNLTVMIYQRRDGSNDYRVGIWMNCYDIANSSSTIRIYGGSGTNPNVMLGNLTSAGLGTVNNLTPTGWGLFAQNAFLHGKVVANGGLIGNWTIGTTGMYYNSDAPSSTSITMIPGGTAASTTSIGGSSGSKSWIFTGKNLFGIDTTGKLYASSAEISGKITANSGSIAGWRIESTYLASGTATAPAANTLLLSPAGTTSSYTVAGATKNGWMITAGTTFGVNKDGGVYATSGKIGPWNVTTTSIYKGANTLGSTTSGAAYFGDLGVSVGNKFKVDATGVATLGLSSGYHATMDTDSFDVLNGSTTLATFGETATIGKMNARGVSIDTNGFKFNNNGEQNFFIGIDNRQAETITSGNATVTNSSTHKSIDGLTYYRVASIPSGATVVSVVGTFESAVENGEPVVFAAEESNVSHWTVNNGYLWVEDGYSSYSQFEETIKYSYTTQANSNLPYMVLGTSAYKDDIIAGVNSFAQGYKNKALGSFSTALGSSTVASGTSSFACGTNTTASGQSSFACGTNAIASDRMSFACGKGTVASGGFSHAEGIDTTASGAQSHAEGASTTASSISSHAEGINTTASGNYSHAEGFNTTASNTSSHSEGFLTTASGEYSHTEGCYTIASGMGSHAGGGHTVTEYRYNTVIGMYNKATVSGTSPNYTYSGTGDYPFIIGNGTADTTARRSNAFTVDWQGNVWAAGKVMATNTSHVGMIIMSTTLNTMAKVKAVYGGTTWIQHSGYFLYGASSGVTANHAAADGGEATHTLTEAEMPSHTHTTNAAYAYYGNGGSVGSIMLWGDGTATVGYTGGGAAHNNMPPFKQVYIWERTA